MPASAAKVFGKAAKRIAIQRPAGENSTTAEISVQAKCRAISAGYTPIAIDPWLAEISIAITTSAASQLSGTATA